VRILFLSRWYPFPADNGSRIRILNIIRQLARCHEVHLISFSSESVSLEQRQAMARFCASVVVVPYRPFQPRGWKALASFFSPRPRSVTDTYSVDFERQVEQMGRQPGIDLVIASQIDMLLYPLQLQKVPRVLDELQVLVIYDQYVEQRHPLKRLRNGLTWWKLARYLAEFLPAYSGCTVASVRERECVHLSVSGHPSVITIPNGIDLSQYAGDFGQPVADTLVYAGALTYQPNFAAVSFFLREIFPAIRAKRPGVRLLVTGSMDGVSRQALPEIEGVIFTGYLDDVRPTIAQSWVSIVPLLAGGGTRVKILESLALNTPVVSTTKGAEGLNLVPGRDFLVADCPDDFAAAVLRLLEDVHLRNSLSRNGRQAVAAQYNWESIGQTFRDFIDMTMASSRGSP
jgi:glycosyltransferase involved in cell wall biosynthesis